MEPALPSALSSWESFYIIVGSSAGALTGLQFVVIALIADSSRRTTQAQIAAFGTPTILHFCAVLLVSAVLSAPWSGLAGPGLCLAVCGGAGVGYAGLVVRRTLRQQGYRPVIEDWLWHALLPFLAYASLLIAGILLTTHAAPALSSVAAASLLLVFVGIHNAWDTVTYIAIDLRQDTGEVPRRSRQAHKHG